jgi:hypothetical protein
MSRFRAYQNWGADLSNSGRLACLPLTPRSMKTARTVGDEFVELRVVVLAAVA